METCWDMKRGEKDSERAMRGNIVWLTIAFSKRGDNFSMMRCVELASGFYDVAQQAIKEGC